MLKVSGLKSKWRSRRVKSTRRGVVSLSLDRAKGFIAAVDCDIKRWDSLASTHLETPAFTLKSAVALAQLTRLRIARSPRRGRVSLSRRAACRHDRAISIIAIRTTARSDRSIRLRARVDSPLPSYQFSLRRAATWLAPRFHLSEASVNPRSWMNSRQFDMLKRLDDRLVKCFRIVFWDR